MKGCKEKECKKIGIFRALQLGDLMCSIPAVRALKSTYPEAEITLVGLPWAANFVKRFSNYFSDFIHFPGYPGLPEQGYSLDSFVDFIENVKSKNFDLLIQMHGDGSIINPMIDLLELNSTAGYHKEGDYCENREGYMVYPEGIPEIERHLALMKFLGIQTKGSHLEFSVLPHEEDACSFLQRKHQLNKKEYVIVHAGARDTKRWWAPEKFGLVADSIAHRGYKVVLTGTEPEKKMVRAVEDSMEFPSINLAGKTELGTMAALVRDAKMVLSNDTGISHIAAAVETPSVVIFLTSDPDRWAPLNKNLHHIILPQESSNIKLVLKKAERLLMDEENEKEFELKMSLD